MEKVDKVAQLEHAGLSSLKEFHDVPFQPTHQKEEEEEGILLQHELY